MKLLKSSGINRAIYPYIIYYINLIRETTSDHIMQMHFLELSANFLDLEQNGVIMVLILSIVQVIYESHHQGQLTQGEKALYGRGHQLEMQDYRKHLAFKIGLVFFCSLQSHTLCLFSRTQFL